MSDPLGLLVSILHRAVEDAVDEALRDAGYGDVTRSQRVVFDTLDADGTRITAMAARARISVQAMGELVDVLQRRGYLQRQPDPADGRAKLVVLTQQGQQVTAAVTDGMIALDGSWQRVLGNWSAASFRRVLVDLVEDAGSVARIVPWAAHSVGENAS